MDRHTRQLSQYVLGGCLLLLLCDAGLSSILWAQARQSSTHVAPGRAPQLSRRPTANVSGEGRASAVTTGIAVKNNLLSVDIHEQELRTVIEAIAAQDAIDVRHLDGLPDTRISARFTSLSVVEGLKRIFRTADIPGYVLITTTQGRHVKVQRILFLPPGASSSASPSSRMRSAPPPPRPRTASAPLIPKSQDNTSKDETANGTSVFDDIKTNTTARRLLSQLVHPNEQVRDRALERLIRVVQDDEKQAELLEFLEPLMEQLASDDQTERNEARAEVRKLLRR